MFLILNISAFHRAKKYLILLDNQVVIFQLCLLVMRRRVRIPVEKQK
jgi:hypothetical protein